MTELIEIGSGAFIAGFSLSIAFGIGKAAFGRMKVLWRKYHPLDDAEDRERLKRIERGHMSDEHRVLWLEHPGYAGAHHDREWLIEALKRHMT